MGRVKSPVCDQFGIDFPLFAFSHCRDVVAAVTNAGGFGVLGGTAFTPQQLDQELSWIDDQVHGRPYGVDIIVPPEMRVVDDSWAFMGGIEIPPDSPESMSQDAPVLRISGAARMPTSCSP